MFTDLESSTALTQRVGDEAAQDVLHGHNDAVRKSLEDHGGREVKHTGDGIMAAFPSAVRAVEAALQIQRDLAGGEVRVRIGLNAGEPIAEDDDFFGTAVQLAAASATAPSPARCWSAALSQTSAPANSSPSTTTPTPPSKASTSRWRCSRWWLMDTPESSVRTTTPTGVDIAYWRTALGRTLGLHAWKVSVAYRARILEWASRAVRDAEVLDRVVLRTIAGPWRGNGFPSVGRKTFPRARASLGSATTSKPSWSRALDAEARSEAPCVGSRR